MNLKTGFGYFLKDGKKINKFELPLGDHPDPTNGASFVEVATREDLDAIVLDKSDEQIAAENSYKEKMAARDSGKAKLKALGLTDEEISALIK